MTYDELYPGGVLRRMRAGSVGSTSRSLNVAERPNQRRDVDCRYAKALLRYYVGNESLQEMRSMRNSRQPINDELKVINEMTHWFSVPRTREMFKDFLRDTCENETTETKKIGSLLANTGAIRESQALASTACGSDFCRFSTSGTTQSNQIISTAYLNPGDIVLCDWGCHVSHHSAIRLTGAFVKYLQPYTCDTYSIVGTVPMLTIIDALNDVKNQGLLHKVKMIILTHSTFYGLFYKNLEEIMSNVLKIVPNMVFLIDEAWFSYAPFHPFYKPFTAMAAARRLQANRPRPDAVIRVVSTASAHKGLPAPRQASVINIIDEKFDEDEFEEAYRTFSTTSWSFPILSGLAKAMRFSRESGEAALDEAIASANSLRRKLPVAGVIPLDEADLIPENMRDVVGLDYAKICYLLPDGITGEGYRTRLHDEEQISIKLVTVNTALVMSVMGTKECDVNTLVRGTERIMKSVQGLPPVKKMPPIPLLGTFADSFSPYPGVGNLRDAYYSAQDKNKVEVLPVQEIRTRLLHGNIVILATAFMPYPPGQQMAVHGHKATVSGMDYIISCLEEGYEVHGVRDGGMRVFKDYV